LILETSTRNTVLWSHQWSKVCSRETMHGDGNGILCLYCASSTFACGYCRLLFQVFL